MKLVPLHRCSVSNARSSGRTAAKMKRGARGMAALVTATLAEPGMMGERIEQGFVTTMIIVVIVQYDDDVIIVVIVHYDDDDHRKPARQRARWSLWRALLPFSARRAADPMDGRAPWKQSGGQTQPHGHVVTSPESQRRGAVVGATCASPPKRETCDASRPLLPLPVRKPS